MCKIENISLGIKELDFTHRGKIIAYFTDGRELIVPISCFPEIKELPMKERNKWMILDDQFFTFESLSTVFSISDLLRAA